MTTTVSQARLDQAIEVLKRKPCTNQELADELGCTYQYASMIMAALKRLNLVTIGGTVGRQNRFRMRDQFNTIPEVANGPVIPALKAWLKADCNLATRTSTMTNTHFYWAIINLVKCIRTYDRQTHETARRDLLKYREQLTNTVVAIDQVLSNTTWWDKDILAKLANDPNCPTTDEINSWVAFAKAKLTQA